MDRGGGGIELVFKSLDHFFRLMMQFFYTGEVSLSAQEDVQPLRDSCYVLGVSSFISRLDELSFSLQCLPNYGVSGPEEVPPAPSAASAAATGDGDPFGGGGGGDHPGQQHEHLHLPEGTTVVPRPRDSAGGETTVYGTYPESPDKALMAKSERDEEEARSPRKTRKRKRVLKSCAREEEEEEEEEDDDGPTEAEKALEAAAECGGEADAARDKEAATNFDTR